MHRLLRRGYQVGALVERERLGSLATARLVDASGSGLYIDLLFAASGVEPELVGHAVEIALTADLVAPVATVGYLIALPAAQFSIAGAYEMCSARCSSNSNGLVGSGEFEAFVAVGGNGVALFFIWGEAG